MNRIVLWIGNEPNQCALANRIHAQWPLAGIVTESRLSGRKIGLRRMVEGALDRIVFPSIGGAWSSLLSSYHDKFPSYPHVPRLDVSDINDPRVHHFTNQLSPELIFVSGTGMIRQMLLSLRPEKGIMNLHTGLSPYMKGGPNCTNWCIATMNYHLIGNTVLWLNAGIDAGDIIASEHTLLDGRESLSLVHHKVMEHAHELSLKSIQSVLNGTAARVPQQELGPGVTYYSRNWGWRERINLWRNFRTFGRWINSPETLKKKAATRTVPPRS